MEVPKNAIVYCRVSSGTQNGKNNVSGDVQERVCRDFIIDNKLRLGNIYKETKSAFKGNRRFLEQLIVDNPNTTIVVYDVTRFTRNVEKGFELINLASRYNVRFAFACNKIIGEKDGKNLHLLMQQAQAESENISRRVKDAKQQKKEQGFHTGGPTPYGYDRELTPHGVKLIENPDQQKVIELIRYAGESREVTSKKMNELMQPISPVWTEQERVYLREGDRDVAKLKRNLTPSEIAQLFNIYAIPAKQNAQWTASRVTSILKRKAADALADLMGRVNMDQDQNQDNDGEFRPVRRRRMFVKNDKKPKPKPKQALKKPSRLTRMVARRRQNNYESGSDGDEMDLSD